MFCTNCGKEISEGKPFCVHCGAAVTDTSEAASSSGPPSGPRRTGMIVGLTAAAVIVLAAIGVGLWLGLRGDGETTDIAGAGATTTTTTIADDSHSPGGSDDGSPEDPGGIASTGDPFMDYVLTQDSLVAEMEYYHARIPELAQTINDNLPDTPQSVYDELEDMAGVIAPLLGQLDDLPIPPGYDTSDYWAKKAGTHMLGRIRATLDGIQAMWDTGSAGSGTPFFDQGRAERDAYDAAIAAYYLSFST